jgi:two-component system, cell cycle sensor histidine kinase and response regulator CckA
MENTDNKTAVAILRQKAEDSLKIKPSKPASPLSEGDSLKLVHELQVHQIELELQNEELLLAKSAALYAANKYAELYDFAPCGYFTISNKDEIIELNICGSQMLGKERLRLKTKQLGFFISDDTKPIYNLFVEKVFTSKVQESCEVTLSANGSSPLYVLLAGIVIDNGEQCLIAMFDITARKQAEEALRELEFKYQLIFNNSCDAIVVFGGKPLKALFFNSAFLLLSGYVQEEALALSPDSMFQIVHPEDREMVINQFFSRFRGENWSKQFEFRIVTKDAEIRWVEISATIYSIREQIVSHSTFRDITERKLTEAKMAELEVLNSQLQKAESLGRMAAAIAHHFNNQLQAVMGNLEIAMDDLPLGVNSNKSLVSAMLAAHKATEVSRLMLTYLGQTPGKHEPIDLSEACRKSLILLQAAAPKGVILNADFTSSGPVIYADAGQMHQILTNLITNAWESFTGNLGAIGLTIKTVSHANIPTSKRFPIDWQPQEIDYACLEVSDTSCGIPDKNIEKLFDPFFTTKLTGRGLGLSVLMGIVKAHGGGVTVESEPGRGSVFRVFLPVSKEKIIFQTDRPDIPEAQQTVAAEKLSKIEGCGTLLLIEDEEQVRNMTKIMLTRLGYTVLEAIDGVEALEIFQQHQDEIRCVLSDLTMPRMNGWETLTALRKLSPDIQVILSSGYDEAQVMADEHPELPNAFLGKPYQLKGLRDTISRVLANC